MVLFLEVQFRMRLLRPCNLHGHALFVSALSADPLGRKYQRAGSNHPEHIQGNPKLSQAWSVLAMPFA